MAHSDAREIFTRTVGLLPTASTTLNAPRAATGISITRTVIMFITSWYGMPDFSFWETFFAVDVTYIVIWYPMPVAQDTHNGFLQ